jgi:hypothetical protein
MGKPPKLAGYVEVADRIPLFWERYPRGAIRTELIKFDGEEVMFRADLFDESFADAPIATGWAHEVVGSSPVNRTSAVENCETSAVGRALANLGFVGKPGAKRPSREEMKKAVPAAEETRAKLVAILEDVPDEVIESFTPKEKAGVEKMTDPDGGGTELQVERAISFVTRRAKELGAATKQAELPMEGA